MNYVQTQSLISSLQLSKVDIRGVEGEAHCKAELGVHQQGHLVLRLLHGSLLHQNQFNDVPCTMFVFYLQATLDFSDKGRTDPLFKLIWKEVKGIEVILKWTLCTTCWGVEVEYLDDLGDSQFITPAR